MCSSIRGEPFGISATITEKPLPFNRHESGRFRVNLRRVEKRNPYVLVTDEESYLGTFQDDALGTRMRKVFHNSDKLLFR